MNDSPVKLGDQMSEQLPLARGGGVLLMGDRTPLERPQNPLGQRKYRQLDAEYAFDAIEPR